MYVKLPLRDLNPNHSPSHSTNTYICKVTITANVYGNNIDYFDYVVLCSMYTIKFNEILIVK